MSAALRRLALGLLALPLAGCASGQQSVYAEYYQALRNSIAGSFGSSAVTRQAAAAVPYASLGYRLNGGRENLLALATDTDNRLMWTSSAHIVLVTENGRIVRTVGLPQDLASLVARTGQALPSPAAALRGPFDSVRLVDIPTAGGYGIEIDCHAVSRGPVAITILGATLRTVQVDESCRSPRFDWSFTDSYWLDPTSGFVWRSRQEIEPKGETVEMEIFRPPG